MHETLYDNVYETGSNLQYFLEWKGALSWIIYWKPLSNTKIREEWASLDETVVHQDILTCLSWVPFCLLSHAQFWLNEISHFLIGEGSVLEPWREKLSHVVYFDKDWTDSLMGIGGLPSFGIFVFILCWQTLKRKYLKNSHTHTHTHTQIKPVLPALCGVLTVGPSGKSHILLNISFFLFFF